VLLNRFDTEEGRMSGERKGGGLPGGQSEADLTGAAGQDPAAERDGAQDGERRLRQIHPEGGFEDQDRGRSDGLNADD